MTQLPLACIAAGLLALGATTSVAAAAPVGYEIVTAEKATVSERRGERNALAM